MLRKVKHDSKNNKVKQTGVISEICCSEQNLNSNDVQHNYDKLMPFYT